MGYGWWGRTIAARLRGSSAITIAFVVEPQPMAAEQGRRDGFRVHDDLAQALAEPAVQAVIIATPHSLHEAQVVAAAQAGKHVFCEKPLALTLASAERCAAACRANGVVLGIGHERRFEPGIERLAQLVREGALGTVLHAEAAFSHDKIADLPADNWRVSKDECPAGGMTGSGIHLTDMLIAMFGRVELVSALTQLTGEGREIGTTVQLGFARGMTASLSAILATPLYISCRVFGTQAWAEVTNEAHPDAPDGRSRLTVKRSGKSAMVETFGWTDAVRANLEAFAAAAEKRAPYRFSDEEILHNIAVLEAIAVAARERRSVRVG